MHFFAILEQTPPMPATPINRLSRLGIMLLDHFFMSFIMMIPMIPYLFYNIFRSFNAAPGEVTDMFDGPFRYLFAVGFSLYLCKDCIDGRSIAKRIGRFQVVNNRTGEPAGAIRCLVRNIFTVVWPIEVIVSLFNTQRRIGDRIAGTKLVVYEPAPERLKPKLIPIVAALVIGFVACTLLFELLPVTAQPGGKPSAENAIASKALQNHLQENIFHKVDFEVKVFDSIDHKSATYIWVYGKLGKNYLADDRSGDLLMEKIESEIDSVYNAHTYRGYLQLRYSGNGGMQMKSSSIGGKISFKSGE